MASRKSNSGDSSINPHWEFSPSGGGTGCEVLTLSGNLDREGVRACWPAITKSLANRRELRSLRVDASGVTECGNAGFSLLMQVQRLGGKHGFQVEIENLPEQFANTFQRYDASNFENIFPSPKRHSSLPEQVGAATRTLWRDTLNNIVFIGEVSRAALSTVRNPRSIRWGEFWILVERAGVDALPLVGLISFIIGLILAFQASIPMKQFGADIFIANLVTLAMFRELGGLMTAIILAGRSGSAFAAEIGTMKVNEELDALNTLGIDRMQFLVLPRIFAGIVVMPLLTIYADLCGVIGGGVVMVSLGHTPASIFTQVLMVNPLNDFFLGFGKSFVFGMTVAAVGCLRGLETGSGASAVGQSTTSAVVSGIFLVIILDGIFSVIFYILGV